MKASSVIRAIDLLLLAIGFLEDLGVNYQEVIDAQKQAKDDFDNGLRLSPQLNSTERAIFINQAQAAVDEL